MTGGFVMTGLDPVIHGFRVARPRREIAFARRLRIADAADRHHADLADPGRAQIAARPALAEEVERPMFLLVAARTT